MNWRHIWSETIGDLPEVHAELCVHTRAEVASCRRCVSSCPTAAWSLDDEQLAIDPDACDGCGLCVASCPEEALTHDHEPELRRWGGQTTAFASCEKADSPMTDALVPCVHAYGLAQLARLYAVGVRQFLMHIGDCDQCPRGTGERLSHRLSRLNSLLSMRDLPGVEARTTTATQWRSVFPAAKVHSDDIDLNRRGFLRRAVLAAADRDSTYDARERRAPGEYLPIDSGTGAVFDAPKIDISRCNGCDACVRICRHEVITLTDSADAYVIDANACTGCVLCSDVCAEDAVKLDTCSVVEQNQIPLESRRCPSCGVEFHRPRSDADNRDLCHICARENHVRNLFQVL